MGTIPSLVRKEESGEEGTILDRGLFSLGMGRGFSAAVVKAGCIFQGETLSGLGMVEFSSHCTFKNHDIYSLVFNTISNTLINIDKILP